MKPKMLSSFSRRLGASSSALNNSAAGRAQPSQPTVLDFLAALSSIDAKKTYHPFDLGLNDSTEAPPVAGSGGHSVVRIGRLREGSTGPNGRMVAVKGLRRTTQRTRLGISENVLLDKHFTQLTLEMRILGHIRLSKHSNIVNLLGICMDDQFKIASLGLVLEYSDLGSMRSFLLHQSEGSCSLTMGGRVDLARQAAEGLKSLHDYRICHGDVKLENILVFREDDAFVAKLSDFGQSVVAINGTEAVGNLHGTPLLEAPELRKGDDFAGASIINALQTDVFSFGLLFWETLNCGRRYFDRIWLDAGLSVVGETDIEAMERCLDSLPQNKLLDYGVQFLLTLDQNAVYQQRAFEVLNGCLQDEPSERKTMSTIVETMSAKLLPKIENSNEDLYSWNDLSDRFDTLFKGDVVVAWSNRSYLSGLIVSAFGNTLELYRFPWALQQHILTELQSIATASTAQDYERAVAAFAVSECYNLGIGTEFNRRECLRWLATAASEGHQKAGHWYHRVCESFGMDSEQGFNGASDTQLDDELSQTPTELYLTARLQKYNARRLESIRGSFRGDGLGRLWSISFNFFEHTNDYPLHVAALYGNDTLITSTNPGHDGEVTGIAELSYRGYSAVHFACIGGHLSTLKLLLAHGGNAAGASDEDITPLHLVIFFPQHDTHAAVDILVKYGANPNAASTSAIWNDLDIVLDGPPLLWAVLLRNRIMVHALIRYTDHTGKMEALKLALSLCFWEIAEDLLNYFEAHGVDFEIKPLQNTKGRFRDRIFHGKDVFMAMHRTVQVCYNHGLFTKPGVRWGLQDNLRLVLQTMRSEADFHLFEALWMTWCSHYPDSQKAPALLMGAFLRSQHNRSWRPILEMLMNAYSVAELNAPARQDQHYNMLHEAVRVDAVVAARILLERGVNVNQRAFETRQTALHICARFYISNEMWELLLEFNAALDARDMTDSTPFEIAFIGERPTLDFEKCTTILQHVPTDDAYIELLHKLLIGLNKDRHARFSLDDLRAVLTQDRSQAYINLPNRNGITLLQQATLLLDINAVKLLLEAGADANVGFHEGIEGDRGAHMILPLQLALFFGVTGMSGAPFGTPNIKKKAYEIALELLSWHQANEDVTLAAATPFHIACLLQLPAEVDRLTANTTEAVPGSKSPAAKVLDTPIPWLSQNVDNGVVTAATLLSCESPFDRAAYSFFGHHKLGENLALCLKLTGKFETLIRTRNENIDIQIANWNIKREKEAEINTDNKLQVKSAHEGPRWRRWLRSLLSNPTRKAEVVTGANIANKEPESNTTPSVLGRYGSQPLLIVAVRNGEEFVAKKLLDHGADVNSMAIGYHEGRTALSFAVEDRNESMVKLLLDHGANVNYSATSGIYSTWTPLSFAVYNRHTDFVKLLLHYGAEADSVINNRHTGFVKLLLHHEDDSVIDSSDDSQTILSFAAEHGYEAIVETLLNRGADTESKTAGLHTGRTPLSLAAEHGHEVIVKMLLDRGACIDSMAGRGEEGRTPLSYAASRGYKVVVELLLDRGADINSKVTEACWKGFTPLIFAAEEGNEATVELLLEYGADTDCGATGGFEGRTALHCAAECGHETIVAMLLAHGANINCKATGRHWTPLEIAQNEGYPSIVQLLLDHKANADPKSTDPCTGSHTAVEATESRQNKPIGDTRYSENITAALNSPGEAGETSG